MKNPLPAIAALVLISSGVPIYSQDNIQEITVTANRFAQAAESLNVATTIITREEIENTLAQNLSDLLLGKAGIHIAQSGGQGGQSSLFMRGTESDHTLVLIDGVQVSTSTGSSARLEYITLDQIERIEIVRGPRSSVYGSEAIGGVLQIFTRKGGEENFQGSVNLSAGTENSTNSSINLSGKVDSTSWAMSYAKRDTDGIDSKISGSDDDDGYSNDSLSLTLAHQLSEQSNVQFVYSEFDAESDFDDGQVINDSKQFSSSYSQQLNASWSSSITFEMFKENNDNLGSFGDTTSETDTRLIRWHNDFDLAENDHLAFGIDSQEQKLKYQSFGAVQSGNSRDNRGVYGVYLFEPDPVDITLSLRHDDNERFGQQSTGSVSIGGRINQKARLWVSYGSAFKAPNLIDLYVDFPSFFFFSNPDLEPETSKSIEFGLAAEFFETNLNINLFQNDIEDLIASDQTFTTLANIEQAIINGVEVTAGRSVGEWALDLNLTFLDHENQTTGNALLRRPKKSFSMQAARQFDKWDLLLDWLVQSEHHDLDPVTFGRSNKGGYGILNVVAGYDFSDSMALRFRIGNLFDKQYSVVDGFNTYGRTGQLSLDMSF